MSAEMIFATTAEVANSNEIPSSEELVAKYMKNGRLRAPSFAEWCDEHPNGTFSEYCKLKNAIHALRHQLRKERQEREAQEWQQEVKIMKKIGAMIRSELAPAAQPEPESERLTLRTTRDETERFIQNTLVKFNRGTAHTFKKFFTASGRREGSDGYTYGEFLAAAQKYGYMIRDFKPSFKDGRPVASY
jgi:hypothetical protein